jgi:ABC-2 type transport system ATP-binding protein
MGSADETSIRVEGLTKRYGPVLALDSISFATEPGEIVGFLGPNGAGKTTTMRILTCFMPASEGRATVAGFDVFRRSLEVRRRIGYLPENVPLYPEMRVREYLDFRAAIKLRGVRRRERRGRIEWALGQCHLEEMRDRIIGQLSKGYRQRVGLADSLVHDPEVLILDEPTEGLDPNQTRDVRELVKELARPSTKEGKRRTILFSTHIIPWVERVCERVIVVDRGRLVADGRAADLVAGRDDLVKFRIRIGGPPARVLPALRAAPVPITVDNLSLGADETDVVLRAERSGEAAIRAHVERAAAEVGAAVERIDPAPIDLEDVFRALTSGADRRIGAWDDAGAEVRT